jgi:uncharacterized oligopeptide transporter (OPT) family protein
MWYGTCMTAEVQNSLQTLIASIDVGEVTLLFALVAIWSIAWKGVALWFAARNYQKRWFIALLILNTLGILEIIYLVWFRRDKQGGVTQSLFNNPLPGKSEEVA